MKKKDNKNHNDVIEKKVKSIKKGIKYYEEVLKNEIKPDETSTNIK